MKNDDLQAYFAWDAEQQRRGRMSYRDDVWLAGVAYARKQYVQRQALLDSKPELPPGSLLVECAQGFVEGWTRSEVTAIVLADRKRREG